MGSRSTGRRTCSAVVSATLILMLFVGVNSQFAPTQDARSVGAGTLSSLVRALAENSRRSPFSARSANARSLPFAPAPTGQAQPEELSTLQSRFSPSAPSERSRFSPDSERQEDLNPTLSAAPTRFESNPSQSSSRSLATGNSEFRFGSNRPKPSSRITFIPQDRGERFTRPHQSLARTSKFASPPPPPPRTTTKRTPSTNPPPVTKKPGTPFEYVYDDYYDDYYYYEEPANETEKKGNQPVNLGPIDPPSLGPETERTPVKKNFNSAPVLPSETPEFRVESTAKPETSNRGGGLSLAERLAALKAKNGNSDLVETREHFSQIENRFQHQPKQTATQSPTFETTTERRVEVRVTNTTESTFVVANIQTSRSSSVREEASVDNTTPFENYDDTTPEPERSIVKENNSNDIPPRTSLTALFGDIDLNINEAREGRADDSESNIQTSPGPKIVDITTEAEKISTTEKATFSAILDKIFEKPKEIDPSILPPGFSLEKATSSTTDSTSPRTTSTTAETSSSSGLTNEILFAKIFGSSNPNVPSNLLPKEFSSTEAGGPSTEKTFTTKLSPKISEHDLYEAIFGRTEGVTPPPDLLPKGFKPTTEKEVDAPKFNIPIGKEKPAPASLLPKGFNIPIGSHPVSTTESGPTTTTPKYATSVGPKGLIFPKRNKKPGYLTTTTESSAASEPSSVKQTHVNLFEKVKSTPTTVKPKPVETTTTTSSTTTTTSTTTSTTTTPKPTTPGVCGERCRLFGTLRIIDGAEWTPELKNRDTKEWQALAKTVTTNLNSIYQRSQLNRWFVSVDIDSFNPGSVLVDYFLNLNEISTDLDTVDMKHIMNGMLQTSNQAEHRLGPLKIDPAGTDFVVTRLIKDRQRSNVIRDDGSYLIPEWLIAVIVISLASFLFIIIFGITVLVSRARVRRRNVPLTEEVLNKLNANQLAGVDNAYHHDSVYDMEAIWNEKLAAERNMKPPSSRGRGYNPNYNVNIYDSWRTDWSGPYGSSATYAKRRPEANF